MITDWVALYDQIALAGFPILLFLLLVGSFLEIWVWGKTHRRDIDHLIEFYNIRIAEWQARSDKQEARADALQDTLFRVSGLLEQSAIRIQHTADRIVTKN